MVKWPPMCNWQHRPQCSESNLRPDSSRRLLSEAALQVALTLGSRGVGLETGAIAASSRSPRLLIPVRCPWLSALQPDALTSSSSERLAAVLGLADKALTAQHSRSSMQTSIRY
jgi:hypothetical protein